MAKELIRLVDCCMAFDGEAVLDHINLYFNDSEFLTLSFDYEDESMKADMTAVLIPVQNNLIEQAFLTSAFLLEKICKKD